jgi:serine/threonine protein kinase
MALTYEYRGRSVQGLPTTNQVITLCCEKGLQCKGFTYSVHGSPIAFIKYGRTVPLGEVRTHLHAYNAFQKMTNNAPDSSIRVPEIYHAFECENRRYIVMEYVVGETAGSALRGSSADKENWIHDQLAKVINKLLRVPVPSGQRPGPVGGGRIQHHFFRDYEAPVEYDSINMLQRHINEVCHQRDSYSSMLNLILKILTHFTKQMLKMTKHQVDFSNEELCLCYSDITEDNFLITKAGQVYVIDFQDAAFLPTTFMSFVLHTGMKPLAKTISNKVSLPKSANLDAMIRATPIFHMTSTKTLKMCAAAVMNSTG